MSTLEPIPGRPIPGSPENPPEGASAFDPLKLCIFTTVALLAWILGPFAVLAFALARPGRLLEGA